MLPNSSLLKELFERNIFIFDIHCSLLRLSVSVILQILWKQCACQCIFIYSSISITGPIICLQSGSLQTNYPCENTRLHFFEIESFGLNQLLGRYSFAFVNCECMRLHYIIDVKNYLSGSIVAIVLL